jgi:hypothetical protein
MSEPKYSDFTLNFNPSARGNDKAPTLKGKAKVIDSDGTPTEFETAAWGPNKAQTGGPDFYNITFTPKDPAHAARQLKTELDGPVLNAIEGFELTKVGTGRLFERTDAEIAKAKERGGTYRSSTATASCCSHPVRAMSTSRPGIDPSTTSIQAMHRCMIARQLPPHARQSQQHSTVSPRY